MAAADQAMPAGRLILDLKGSRLKLGRERLLGMVVEVISDGQDLESTLLALLHECGKQARSTGNNDLAFEAVVLSDLIKDHMATGRPRTVSSFGVRGRETR